MRENDVPPFGFFFALRSFTLTAGLALALVRFFRATFLAKSAPLRKPLFHGNGAPASQYNRIIVLQS